MFFRRLSVGLNNSEFTDVGAELRAPTCWLHSDNACVWLFLPRHWCSRCCHSAGQMGVQGFHSRNRWSSSSSPLGFLSHTQQQLIKKKKRCIRLQDVKTFYPLYVEYLHSSTDFSLSVIKFKYTLVEFYPLERFRLIYKNAWRESDLIDLCFYYVDNPY